MPTPLSSAALTATQQGILTCLAGRHGASYAIKQTDLAEAIGVTPRHITSAIKDLIERHGHPIGSYTGSPAGYFLVTSPEDQAKAEIQLQHRIVSLARRLSHLRKNTPAQVLQQISQQIELGFELPMLESKT